MKINRLPEVDFFSDSSAESSKVRKGLRNRRISFQEFNNLEFLPDDNITLPAIGSNFGLIEGSGCLGAYLNIRNLGK